MAETEVVAQHRELTTQHVAVTAWHAARVEWLGLVLCTLALSIRLWGINYGLPYSYNPDEHVVIGTVVHMLRDGTPDPRSFTYPSGLYYLLACVLAAYQLITGTVVGPPPSETGLGLYPTPAAIFLARIVVALLSVVTVIVVYRVARSFAGTWPAAGGTLLLALSALSIVQGQVVTTDGPSAMGMALAAACCVLAVRNERPQAFWFAGIALGLAVGLKYTVAAGAVMLIVAYAVVVQRRLRRCELTSWRELWRDQRLWGFALIPVAFLITTPFALRHPGEFARNVLAQGTHYGAIGHPGAEGGTLAFTLSQMFHTPEAALSVLACIGVAHAVARKRIEPLLVASGALASFVVVATPKVHFARNLVPLWSLLAILAAEGLFALAHILPRLGSHVGAALRGPRGRMVINGALMVAFVAGLIPMSASAIRLDQMRNETDIRTTASQWVAAHLPPGTHLAIESYSVTLAPDRYDVTYLQCGLFTEPIQWYSTHGIQYAIASALIYSRYLTDGTNYPLQRQAYLSMFSAWPVVKTFVGDDTSGQNAGLTILLLRVSPSGTASSPSSAPYTGSQAIVCPQ